jgi:membrane-bound lytic murein transglycosylase D
MRGPRTTQHVVLGAALLAASCASSTRATTARVEPTAPPVPSAPLSVQHPQLPDPVAILIAESERHFTAGQRDVALGHLERAKTEFDLALDMLLESPDGARGDPRLREHFERLVDRISALEQRALATGDGFTETKSEPATIDTLLAIEPIETPPTAATSKEVEADLESTHHDIPIPSNTRVLRYVELFKGRLKEFLTEGLGRGAQYLPMIQDVFRAEGLPLDLAYVPLVESAFKPSALSRAKAFGMWQFMHGTAIENGLKSDWYLDERADPIKATVAAAKYWKTLFGMFEDWHLAMASYNGGPGRVQRAITRSRKTDFWTLTANNRFLPRETRDYVPMILAAVLIAKNPAQYGFDVVAIQPTPSETVELPAALDLRRVAEWSGASMDEIERLNPEYRRWTTPIRPGEYTLRVPVGTADRVREGLAASPPGQLSALQWYTVKKGESISTIAKKHGVSRTDLAEANYLRLTSRVLTGQRLLIPRMPSAALLARASSTAVDAEVAIAETEPVISDEPTRVVYRVRAGDTLSSIARRHGTTVDQLKAWNKMRDTRINVGDRLVIQTSRVTNAQQN